MPSAITFRLKSATCFDTVSFEGRSLKCRDLRPLIAAKLRLPANDGELLEIFCGDRLLSAEDDVGAYAQVVVARRVAPSSAPGGVGGRGAGGWRGRGAGPKPPAEIVITAARSGTVIAGGAGVTVQRITEGGTQPSSMGQGRGQGWADDADGDEDERRIRGMGDDVLRSTASSLPSVFSSGFRGGRGRGGQAGQLGAREPPPADYICHACGRRGHYIEDCDNQRSDARRYAAPLGIAESQLEMVDASDATGAKFVTRDGRFVRRRVEATTLASSGAVDQPPLDGGAAGRPNAVPSASLPDDVTCRLCQNLLVHAVAFTCCQGLACATCAEKATQTALEAWQRRLGAMESRAGGMLEEDDDNDDDVAEGAAGGPTCPLCFGHLRVEGDVVLLVRHCGRAARRDCP